MKIQWIFPNPDIAIQKYGKLYRREDAEREIHKIRIRMEQTYLFTSLLFLLSFTVSLARSIRGSGHPMDPLLVLLIFTGIFFLIYKKRYERIDKQVFKAKETMIDDFPQFIDKLVLLLNAGMVTEAALKKIVIDYRTSRNVLGRRALYEGLLDMMGRIEETNVPLQRELSEYAAMSGVREMLRFSAIIEDNLSKGSGLCEKLEGEGALLWMGRKKRAEEKARLAETKLSLPLMLLLLSLMVITTAPILLTI